MQQFQACRPIASWTDTSGGRITLTGAEGTASEARATAFLAEALR